MTFMGRYERNLHKLGYYLNAVCELAVPRPYWLWQGQRLMEEYGALASEARAEVDARVAWYNRLEAPFNPGPDAIRPGQFARRGQRSAYYLDFKRLLQCLPDNRPFRYEFGDVTWVPEHPSFVKSRPVAGDGGNANSVLLKLNQVRHYFMVEDPLRFREKAPLAVWRGKGSQSQRKAFLERYHDSPLCNVGCNHEESIGKPWHTGFMPASEQLNHRYIVSIEGNDVATNLKWIFASNSLCLMRRPRYETWFMEGALEPDVHYACLADDHSDLEEQIRYYNAHPEAAEAIIRNAQAHVARFMDARREWLISLLVMRRYFDKVEV